MSAVTVPAGFVLVPEEVLAPFSEMAGELFALNFNNDMQAVCIWVDDKSLVITAKQFFDLRRALATRPAITAGTNAGAVDVPYDDFYAAYRFVPRSKVSPDQCLKTRLRDLLRDEDLTHADEAEAITAITQKPAVAVPVAAQPGEAVREALKTARDYISDAAAGTLTYEDSGEGFRAMATEDLTRIDAALASVPAPVGDDAYYDAIAKCLERYSGMASAHGMHRLFDFILEAEDAVDDKAPINKLNRWLGYIQGTLIASKITTVETERDWTRPLFRPLDFPALSQPKEPRT